MDKNILHERFKNLVEEYDNLFEVQERELQKLEADLMEKRNLRTELSDEVDRLKEDLRLAEARRILKEVAKIDNEINEIIEDISFVKEIILKGNKESEIKLKQIESGKDELRIEFQKIVSKADEEEREIREEIEKLKNKRIKAHYEKYSDDFEVYRKLSSLYSEYYFKKI